MNNSRGAACWKWMIFTVEDKNFRFRMSCCSYVGRTYFWPLSRLKRKLRTLFPEKGCLGAGILDGSTENFEMMLFGCLAKTVALVKFFVSANPVLCQKNRMWTPKYIVFGMGTTWFAGSKWVFSDAQHNSHKLRKLQCFVFC